MPHNPLDWLKIADAFALALVALRLSFGGLFRVYPAFYIHAIFESLKTVGAFVIPWTPYTYGLYYVIALPISWALWVAVVVSLYQQTLGLHKGLYTIGRRVLIAGLIVSALFVALTLRLDLATLTPSSWILTIMLAFERALTAALAVLLLALCSFLAWFVIPTRRNCAYLCMGLGVVFAGLSATILVRNASGTQLHNVVDILSLVLSIAVFVTLAVVISPDGEEKTAFVGRRPSALDVEIAVSRLGALTSHLRQDPPEVMRG